MLLTWQYLTIQPLYTADQDHGPCPAFELRHWWILNCWSAEVRVFSIQELVLCWVVSRPWKYTLCPLMSNFSSPSRANVSTRFTGMAAHAYHYLLFISRKDHATPSSLLASVLHFSRTCNQSQVRPCRAKGDTGALERQKAAQIRSAPAGQREIRDHQ